jgi:hypothetical protein
LRSIKIFLLFLIVAALGSFALWACYPDSPTWMLWDGSAGVLATPTTWLREAVHPLLPRAKPAFSAAVDPKGPLHQTAVADRKDLETALAGLPPERRQAVIGPYMQVRDAIVEYRTELEAAENPPAYRAPGAAAPAPAPGPPMSLTVPPGLPGEFADYLRGATPGTRGIPAPLAPPGRS